MEQGPESKELERIFSESSTTIVVREHENYLKIIKASNSVHICWDTSQNKLKIKNLEILMPAFIAKEHHKIMKCAYESVDFLKLGYSFNFCNS